MEEKNSKKQPQQGKREFKDELGARLFDILQDVFPSMELTYTNGNYVSKVHIDGRRSTETATKIYANNPFYVFDWADARRSIDLIQATIDVEHKADNYIDALKYLCRCAAMDVPKLSSEQEAYFGRCSRFQAAAKTFHEALMTDTSKEAQAVRDYLTKSGDFKESGRGWSAFDVENSLLGYVSKDSMRLLFTEDELARLSKRDEQIGSKFTLAIPILTGGRVTGMKFRNIFATEKKDRYHALTGSEKVTLSYIPERVTPGDNDTLMVVEGDMDALHHMAMWRQAGYDDKKSGLYPVVATSGNGLTKGMIEDAVRRGFYNFILALDADKAGVDFTLNSARDICQAGGSAFILQYPDCYKDMDEMYCDYVDGTDGKKHHRYNANDIQEWAKGADSYGRWQTWNVLAGMDENTPNTVEAAAVRKASKVLGSVSLLERDTLAKWAEAEFHVPMRLLLKEDKQTRNKKLSEAFSRIASYYTNDREKEAERALKQLKRLDSDEEDIEETTFAPQSNEVFDMETPAMKNIDTPYMLGGCKMMLQSGGITVIGARSGHGKTMMMLNLLVHSLDATKDGGTVVYFMAECSRRTIRDRLAQIYAAVKRESDDEALSDIDSFLTSGRLMMFADKSTDTVCERIRMIHGRKQVKAVFLDYVQLLRPAKDCFTKKDRMEENCTQIEAVAKETSIAVVLGAQLNRADTKDPISMNSDAIADAIDIEQIASQIFLLWNSTVECDSLDTVNARLQNEGLDIQLDEHGDAKLLVKCAKTRTKEMKKGSMGVLSVDDDGALTSLDRKFVSRNARNGGRQDRIKKDDLLSFSRK